jgi:hypothetical protein
LTLPVLDCGFLVTQQDKNPEGTVVEIMLYDVLSQVLCMLLKNDLKPTEKRYCLRQSFFLTYTISAS